MRFFTKIIRDQRRLSYFRRCSRLILGGFFVFVVIKIIVQRVMIVLFSSPFEYDFRWFFRTF